MTDHVVQPFECRDCESISRISVHPDHANQAIGYACSGECDGATKHDPVGPTDWFNALGRAHPES